ncbi:MAG TPA: septal ring lytic transglycosylase RlpA family protein [Candidatus Sulfotelmatobacter sp.]
MRRRLAQGLALILLVAGLEAAQSPRHLEATPAPTHSNQITAEPRAQAAKTKPYQVGTASWYGEDFDGKPTASGEPYDMNDMTAASLTIPLGTYVKVTNLHNGRAVVVKVNDRGPVVPGRIIDVSYGAAQALEFKNKGLQRVRVDLVKPHQKPTYETVAFNRPTIEIPSR